MSLWPVILVVIAQPLFLLLGWWLTGRIRWTPRRRRAVEDE